MTYFCINEWDLEEGIIEEGTIIGENRFYSFAQKSLQNKSEQTAKEYTIGIKQIWEINRGRKEGIDEREERTQEAKRVYSA